MCVIIYNLTTYLIIIMIFLVHYNGYLEYSDEPYDSTRLRNQPLQVRLGNQEVIPGYVGIHIINKISYVFSSALILRYCYYGGN